jgi:hypothetical protein
MCIALHFTAHHDMGWEQGDMVLFSALAVGGKEGFSLTMDRGRFWLDDKDVQEVAVFARRLDRPLPTYLYYQKALRLPCWILPGNKQRH